jgi:hypothetical protein
MYPLSNHSIACHILMLIYFKINSNHIKLYFIFHFGITYSKSNENRDIFVPVHNCIELCKMYLEIMNRCIECLNRCETFLHKLESTLHRCITCMNRYIGNLRIFELVHNLLCTGAGGAYVFNDFFYDFFCLLFLMNWCIYL